MLRFISLLPVVFIMLALGLPALASPALAGPPDPPDEWIWQNPLPQGNDLEAVWGRAADDVYAIGGDMTLLHWDGAAWSVASRPQSMPVTDMWGLDDGTLFAVGWYGVVLRFDGTVWTEVAFPPGAHLKAVVAFSATELFVAETFPGNRIWHHDGNRWSEIGTAPDGIHDLGGSGPDDLWVSGFEGMLSHWDGATWTPEPTIDLFDITSVWANAADDVFALALGSRLYHYDGEGWTLVGTDAATAWESDMWSTSFNDCWFVDESGDVSHFDGAAITKYTVPSDGFVGVWGDGLGNVHAIGPGGGTASFDGLHWTSFSSSATYENLRGVWQVSPAEIYAVGALEIVIRWDGVQWTQIHPTSFSVWFNDVWAPGPDDAYLVGKAGIKHWNGAEWTFMDDGLRHLLLPHHAIWGFGPDDIVVVGDWGAIVRWDGLDWTIVRHPDPGLGNLNGVWGAAPDDIWAVGPQGHFLHWDGLAWNEVPVPTGGLMTAIHGWATDDIWTLGQGGELYHWDGDEWTFDGSFPGTVLTDLHGETSADLHVMAGWGGVWHYDEGTWTLNDTGARTGLDAIWVSHENGMLVVGNTGSVLSNSDNVTAAPEFVAGARLHASSEPNPFNPSTVIRFEVPHTGHVRLTIHDAAGRRMATLVDGRRAAGPHTVTWHGRDDAGRRLASGVYLAQVRTDTGREVHKLTLVK